MRALLVEDEPSYQALLREMLESLGAEVVVASNVSAAWEAARGKRFDVALIDAVLAGGDGAALAKELHESLKCRRTILMSGYPSWWLRSRTSGGSPTLTKPFRIAELSEALDIAPQCRVAAPVDPQAARPTT